MRKISDDIKLSYDDVLIVPQANSFKSRKDIEVEVEYGFLHSSKVFRGVPIMTANMATCGTFEIAKVLSTYNIITTFHKYYTVSEYVDFFKEFNSSYTICYTLGSREKDIEQLKEMIEMRLIDNFDFICIDVPNGYIDVFIETISLVRGLCPNHIIIAGNVVTPEQTLKCLKAGCDVVKIGIGPGSACTTRRMAGVGYPQISAVLECSKVAQEYVAKTGHRGRVICDGGQQFVGDVCKGFCAGADFNMFGSMFSGYDESGGEVVEFYGKKYKEYFGSSSTKALNKFYGKKDKHRASEGRETYVEYKGSIHDFIQELFGGIRSCGTYIGAKGISEFFERSVFVRTNQQVTNYLEQNEKLKK